MEKEKKGFEDIVWDFFCSLKLGIVTLILLATTSIVGTVLKQGQSMGEYVQERFMRMFPEGLPHDMTQSAFDKLKDGFESTYRFYDTFNFFDMYHSYWFLALLALFAMNLICCSINRLPRVLKLVREPELTPDENFYRLQSNSAEIVTTGSVDEVRDRIMAFMAKRFTAARITNGDDGRVHLFAQKAAYARFGVYVTHLSILIILIGAIIGVFYGSKGFAWISEGSTIDAVDSRDSREKIALGFSVRCDDFSLEYYEGTSRPKSYRSELAVVENGQEVFKKSIVVNDPLQYKGYTFYQSSYREGRSSFRLRATPRDGGEPIMVSGFKGDHVALPDGYSLAVSNYYEDYKKLGPVVEMHLNTPDGRHNRPFLVYKGFPGFDKKRNDVFAFDLIDFQQSYATGLQVAKDPGVEVVWVGCTLMVLGTLVAFFLSHRRIWVTISKEDGKLKVLAGGSGHRNQPGFSLFFDEFKKDLEDTLS